MRQKLTDDRAMASVPDDSIPIDMGDAARQLALFESGIGWQHGVIEILVALLAASMFVLRYPFVRSGSKDRR
jgi:hypothetical protein